jgi:hypothetical protein
VVVCDEKWSAFNRILFKNQNFRKATHLDLDLKQKKNQILTHQQQICPNFNWRTPSENHFLINKKKIGLLFFLQTFLHYVIFINNNDWNLQMN